MSWTRGVVIVLNVVRNVDSVGRSADEDVSMKGRLVVMRWQPGSSDSSGRSSRSASLRAVDRDAFWSVIERLGPDLDLDSFRVALAARTGEEISTFWDHLVACAAALNTEQHRGQTPVDVGDDLADPLPLGDDAFLDARVAVIAHGREAYEAVLHHPERFAAVWPFELGGDLVEAVGEAFESSTGEPWPALNPYVPAPSRLPRAKRSRWLAVYVRDYSRVGRGVRPGQPYDAHMGYLERLMNEDQRWWAWWDDLRGEESRLVLELDPKPVKQLRSTLQSGRGQTGYDEVRIAVRVPESEFDQPLTSETPALGWAMLARAHFDLLLSTLSAKTNVELPAWLPPTDTAALDEQRRRRETEEGARDRQHWRAEEAWQRHRSSEHIWRGRAPDEAVDQLITATKGGKRLVALPQMIADLRHTHNIAPAPDDADRLAEAGYSPEEIAIALSPLARHHSQ